MNNNKPLAERGPLVKTAKLYEPMASSKPLEMDGYFNKKYINFLKNYYSEKKEEESKTEPKQMDIKDKDKLSQNNCLFEAVLTSFKKEEGRQFGIRGIGMTPPNMREICNNLLEDENLPTFEDGEPAGEQYITIVSLILDRQINVYKDFVNEKVCVVKHEKVFDSAKTISIMHLGDKISGHWVSVSKNANKPPPAPVVEEITAPVVEEITAPEHKNACPLNRADRRLSIWNMGSS